MNALEVAVWQVSSCRKTWKVAESGLFEEWTRADSAASREVMWIARCPVRAAVWKGLARLSAFLRRVGISKVEQGQPSGEVIAKWSTNEACKQIKVLNTSSDVRRI